LRRTCLRKDRACFLSELAKRTIEQLSSWICIKVINVITALAEASLQIEARLAARTDVDVRASQTVGKTSTLM
jgi:hypothetical protein